jgi:integrase/recombinase XerD
MNRESGFGLYREWHGDQVSRLGPSTIGNYRYQVLKALADIGKDPLRLQQRDLEKYLQALRTQSAVLARSALVDFFKFLVRKGYRPRNPLHEKVRNTRRTKRRIKRGLTEEELTRLLVAAVYAARRRYTGQKLAWAILAQYALGLRPGEMVALTPDKIALDGAAPCAYITDTKTGADRVVPISKLARDALTELLRTSNGWLVGLGRTHYGDKVKRAAILAGIAPEKCRAYALRHTAATHMVERGIHIRVVAEFLGHSDLRPTAGYTVPSDKFLRAAVDSLG